MSVTSPLARFTEHGFLGADCGASIIGGDPNSDHVRFEGVVPLGGVADDRLPVRRSLLESADALAKSMERNKQFEALDSHQQQAYALVLGEAKRAFQMSQEKPEVRDRYGRNTWGQAFLLARRLVEHGVPFITVNFGGWDTHRDHFGRLKVLMPTLDQAFSALLEDLADRGLLTTTIVTWCGEFGRTPKIDPQPPWDGGRHHYGHAQSVVVAGGGFRGGVVVGETDAKGEFPKHRTLYPWDLSASLYMLLGIDPDSTLPHPHGRVAYVTPRPGCEVPSGGLLTEIL